MLTQDGIVGVFSKISSGTVPTNLAPVSFNAEVTMLVVKNSFKGA